MITRRALLGSAVAAAASTIARHSFAAEGGAMPVALVSHGGPLLAVDPVRGPALRAWGARLPKPAGVLAITPHWGSRRLELGATGRGVAQYDFPAWLADKLPADLAYRSPPSEALAKRVEALLGGDYHVQRSARTGMDHTTWMPLLHLLPAADVPVLELAYPYLQESQLFELGRRLAPLRDEGILLLASGGMTHNLASVDLEHADVSPPSWSREFDAWAAEKLAASDADALLDWRHKAPAADLAHPDDGGHFRVMLVGGRRAGSRRRLRGALPLRGVRARALGPMRRAWVTGGDGDLRDGVYGHAGAVLASSGREIPEARTRAPPRRPRGERRSVRELESILLDAVPGARPRHRASVHANRRPRVDVAMPSRFCERMTVGNLSSRAPVHAASRSAKIRGVERIA